MEWLATAAPKLPALNAVLNATATLLLLVGYMQIRARRTHLHRAFMIAAFAVSSVFLISYVIYHAMAGHTTFSHGGAVKLVYLLILLTHVVLAMGVAPLALAALWLAWRGRFEKHRRVARVLFPIWLYVSVTGVVIYLMLYVFFPGPPGA